MLVTTLRCCQHHVGDRFFEFKSRQQNYSVTNILKLSPSRSHEYNVNTNIIVEIFRLRQQARNEAKESPSSMPPKIYIFVSIGWVSYSV